MKDFLRNKREGLNLTLKEMVVKSNIKYQTLYQYESEVRFPHATEIWKVKSAYEVTDEELVQWLKFIYESKRGDVK